MPLIEATGTRVDRISPESVKNSIAPERNWLSMSVSEPSWLLGKISISTRPLVCALMRSIASLARTLSGWVVGTLLAYLNENSGAARATHGIATVTPAAAPAKSAVRRVAKIVMMLPPYETASWASTAEAARVAENHGGSDGEGEIRRKCQDKARIRVGAC